MKKGLLWKTKIYLAGNLETEDYSYAVDWRKDFADKVKEMGIITLSPLEELFINYPKEDKDFQDKLKAARANGEFDYVHEEMVKIRSRDLICIDVSTCIVAVINPDKPSWGTVDEIILATRQNKNVFLVIKDGPRRLPLWLFSYFTKEWVFDNLDQVVDRLKTINEGKIELDPKYWRLFKEEYL